MGSKEFADVADGFPQVVDCASFYFPEMGFEFGEGHLDGIEVWAIGRQKEEPRAYGAEDVLGFFTFVSGEIVENDDVASSKLRSQLGLDISIEDQAVHGGVDDKGRDEAV